ncbi:MAG: RNA-binding protein [Chitinophagaceae bacterium]|nr:RNA-binding protein [Chitinophagaceae bacterium]
MKIAITNLNKRTTVEHLQRLFNRFGVVRSAKILRDDPAGRSACYGIVRLDYPDGLVAIAELNNLLFMDHYLEVYEMGD